MFTSTHGKSSLRLRTETAVSYACPSSKVLSWLFRYSLQIIQVSVLIFLLFDNHISLYFTVNKRFLPNFHFQFEDGLSYKRAEFGASTGPVFLETVQCSSSHDRLLECPSSPILTVSSYCTNTREAGVGCEGKLMLLYYNAYSIKICTL